MTEPTQMEWTQIGNVTFPIGTKLSVIERKFAYIDIFATGSDGTVWSVTRPTSEGWKPWFQINPGYRLSPASPVTAVARKPEQIDLFICGTNGIVESTGWSLDAGWRSWFKIMNNFSPTFPLNTQIAAIARTPDNLDIFGVLNASFVDTSAWSPDTGWIGWFPIHNEINFSPGTPITALTRDSGHIDLFIIGNDGCVWSTAWSPGTGWISWFRLGNITFPPNTQISAVSRTANDIDLFATATDERVWSINWSSTSGWHYWYQIYPEVTFPPGTPVASLSRKSLFQETEGMDIFAVGKNGIVKSATWSSSRGWNSWIDIGTTTFPLNTPISVLHRPLLLADAEIIDLFATGANGGVWWTETFSAN